MYSNICFIILLCKRKKHAIHTLAIEAVKIMLVKDLGNVFNPNFPLHIFNYSNYLLDLITKKYKNFGMAIVISNPSHAAPLLNFP